MHRDQATYRDLCEAIWAYEGKALYDDLLTPWLEQAGREARWLAGLRAHIGNTPKKLCDVERWRLYALNRVLDLIRLHANASAYKSFAVGLGLDAFEPESFHPFWHEIAKIDPAETETIDIVETFWPALTLGPLLVARAVVRVRAARTIMDPGATATSTLYWAYVRDRRPTEDLSSGWGGNSQWRTPHRLDYATSDTLHFNFGADGGEVDSLSSEDALELLRYRCFLRSWPASPVHAPYNISHSEPR